MPPGGAWIIAGGTASAVASAAHLACIAGGPRWYRAFGAGERVAREAERGLPWPALMTVGIAGVLALWSAYAFSGAGVIRALPLLRVGLVAITAMYLARGAVLFFPAMLRRPDLSAGFLFWSSLIVLAIGVVHAVGLVLAWPNLSGVR